MTDKRDKVRYLIKDTWLFAVSSFGSKVLIILLMPLYTNVLSTEQYGIADLINTTVLFTYPVFTLSISEATLRYSMENGISKRSVFVITMLFTLVSFGTVMMLKPFAGMIDAYLEEYWSYFIGIFCLNNINIAFSSFVKGVGMTKLFAISGIVQTFSAILSNILFLIVFDFNIYGYLWSIIIGYTVSCMVMFIGGKLYKYVFPIDIDKSLLKTMLCYCTPLIPTIIAWAVNASIDKYMIIEMVGMSDNGIYSIAHKIPGMMTTIMSIFINAWQLSAISNHGEQDEIEYQTNVYRVFSIVALLGCFMLIVINKPLSYLLFANEFALAWRFVPFLIVSAFFSSLSNFLGASYRAAKKTSGLLFSLTVGAVMNILMNFIFIGEIGALGAAIATATSFFTVWLIRIISIQRILTIKIDVFRTLVSFVLFFSAAIVSSFDFGYSVYANMVMLTVVCVINISDIKYILSGIGRIISGKGKNF